MVRIMLRAIVIATCVVSFSGAIAQPRPSELDLVKQMETNLKFDDMFPRRPYTGKTANIQGWSFDDRYLAYNWNPYQIRGNDLWLWDSKTQKSTRLTSIEMMANYDRDAKLAIEFNKKEDERLAEWDKLSDADWREARQKLKEEREKPGRKPDPFYGGVGAISWAHKSHEFIMNFKGDLWRWKVGAAKPVRLTQTRDAENRVEYLPDDSGFVFQRGNGVYRMGFDSNFVQQINPELPTGVTMAGYSLSKDGTQMLVYGNRTKGPDRQVDWITYRNRFAEAKKTERGVAEDDFNSETTIYLFDITPSALENVSEDLKPYEIYRWPGGEEWYDLAINANPWSPDGSTIVFSSFKRDKKQLLIHEADLKRKKVRVVYEGTSDGEHGSPGLCDPFYTSDGKNIVALLDKSGWRHLHLIERVRGAERQVTTGSFEVYPKQMSADKKSVLVTSSKESLARMQVYSVNLETGAMTQKGHQTGTYGNTVFGEKSDIFASAFNSWSQRSELFIEGDFGAVQATDSHRKEFWNVIVQKPELFSFKNRHGDEVHGYRFVPANHKKGDKRPLFIYVYGGPLGTGNSVGDGDFNTTGFMFNMYLTNVLGYITATIDPRGSSGYSAAFGKANFDAPGVGQTEDLVDCVKYFAENYGVDSSRVGLNGWSFGGWQTQHTMYTAGDVFTLGIAGAGPTEWQNYNTWYTGGVIGNTPKNQPDYLDKYSLTKIAKNLKGDLLLLHGIEDTNVLFQDTIHVYRKLLQAGKGPLVELALDPTGGHGMGGDMDSRDRHAIYLSYLLRHWGLPSMAISRPF